jgi:hypothetical protein
VSKKLGLHKGNHGRIKGASAINKGRRERGECREIMGEGTMKWARISSMGEPEVFRKSSRRHLEFGHGSSTELLPAFRTIA